MISEAVLANELHHLQQWYIMYRIEPCLEDQTAVTPTQDTLRLHVDPTFNGTNKDNNNVSRAETINRIKCDESII